MLFSASSSANCVAPYLKAQLLIHSNFVINNIPTNKNIKMCDAMVFNDQKRVRYVNFNHNLTVVHTPNKLKQPEESVHYGPMCLKMNVNDFLNKLSKQPEGTYVTIINLNEHLSHDEGFTV